MRKGYRGTVGNAPNSDGTRENAKLMLRELSEPWASGERTKTAIGRVADLAGFAFWRASDIWYGKAQRIEQHELNQIADALQIKNEKAARDELRDLKTRIARLEASLLSKDAEFFRPSTDFAGDMLRQLIGQNRTVVRE
jgi:DNA polymerase/3'-5' exonuclease PolX